MPVRSARGRAALWRRVWGWPMRSPTHLSAAVLVVLVTAAGVGFAQPSTPDTPPSRPRPVPAAPNLIAPRPAPPIPPRPAPSVPIVPPDVVDLARTAATAWLHHPDGTTPQQWLHRLRPLGTPELLVTLAEVDPARVPGTRATSEPRPTVFTGFRAGAHVATDAGGLDLTLVRTPAGWRVQTLAPTAAL